MNQQPISFRTGTANDAMALARLHVDAVITGYQGIFPKNSPKPSPETLVDGWTNLINDPGANVLVATISARVIGSVVVTADSTVPSGLVIKRLHVSPTLWGQGLGSELHDRALDVAVARGATKINLWVLEHNTRARTMYERRGWQLCEPRRTFANDPPTVLDVLYQTNLLATRLRGRGSPSSEVGGQVIE